MPNPRGTPLIEFMHQELDAAIGAANVPLVLETVTDWLEANNRPKSATTLKITDRDALRERLRL